MTVEQVLARFEELATRIVPDGAYCYTDDEHARADARESVAEDIRDEVAAIRRELGGN